MNQPFGKQIIFKQNDHGAIVKYKEGYFMLSWNDHIEEDFKEKGVDFSTNEEGPHQMLAINDENLSEERNKIQKELDVEIFKQG